MARITPIKERQDREQYASWDLLERLFNDVNVLDTTQCWHWKNSINPEGYGVTTRKINKKVYGFLTHRIVYYFVYGVIPDGMVVDHACHNPKTCVSGRQCVHRRCYNPYHLRLVTREENNKIGAGPRKNVGLCRNKLHEWSDDNVYTYPSGKQMCMACQKAQMARKRERKRVKQNADNL